MEFCGPIQLSENCPRAVLSARERDGASTSTRCDRYREMVDGPTTCASRDPTSTSRQRNDYKGAYSVEGSEFSIPELYVAERQKIVS